MTRATLRNFSAMAVPDSPQAESSSQAIADRKRDCLQEKETYDQCFRNWYRYSYLRRDFEDPCKALFDKYRACLEQSLKQRGLDSLLKLEDPIWKDN
jgi:hypothetical protein